MSAITVESLGLSTQELSDRLVERMAALLLEQWKEDPDAFDDGDGKTPFRKRLEKRVLARIDAAIEEIAGRHVLPNVAAYVETLTMQETNRWGEKTGKAMTFVEYLVERAEHYLTEKVNYDGKSQDEARYSGSGFSATQTRVAHLIHQHLQYSISTAIGQALKDVNSKIVLGLQETVKLKLAEALAGLKVKAEIGR